jgi:glutathione S-transferase
MILIGMFDSPFVRRVAVSMNLYAMPFEHRNWSVGRDFELIRQFNPLGRVPTLVLPNEDALIESAAILDYLDELAGPERALLPRGGPERREALRLMAIATGAAEKGVLQIYEGAFRPQNKRHEPWLERCRRQMHAALAVLESQARARGADWLLQDRITQADVTVACVFTFLSDALLNGRAAEAYPALGAFAARCEALREFSAVKAAWFSPPAAQREAAPPQAHR